MIRYLYYMIEKRKKLREFFGLVHGIHSGRIHPSRVSMLARKAAKQISPSDIKEYAKSTDKKLPLKIRKEILGILKDIQEPMYLNEEEKSNPIAKTWNVDGDYELEIKKYNGLTLSQKEMEAIDSYTEVKPTKIEKNQIRYETTDAFSNTTTTVIKKLKDGSSQFCFTAFTKYDQSSQPKEKEENPSIPITTTTTNGMQPPTNNKEENKETIVITKSSPFNDEISGAAIMSEFLKKIDL
jgi:hypothetical protein